MAILSQAAQTVNKFCQLAKRGRVDRRSMLGRLCLFATWLSKEQCYIRDIHEKIVPLKPNAAQVLLLASWMVQAAREVPIRTSVLKARKGGVSTFIQAWYFFCCKYYRNQIASTLAHQTKGMQEIFDITHRVGLYEPMCSGPYKPKQNRTMLFFWPSDSRYSCNTAGAEGVGAGGTPNLLHLSEIALLPEATKKDVRASAINAVPNTPTSMIVQESTARGRDSFFDLFEAAHNPDHPYEAVFIPWFLDETLSAPVSEDWQPDIHERAIQVVASEIQAVAAKYGLVVTPEQFAWRRQKIAEIGEHLFRQEYPSTPQEAVQARTGLILPGMRGCVIDQVPFDYEGTAWYQQRIGGWDYGYRHPTAMASAVLFDDVIFIIDLYRASGELTEACAIRTLEGHLYYCDPSALGPREELAAECRRIGTGARFQPAPRGRGERERMQVKDEWEMVRRYMDHGRLFVHRGCSHQIVLEADSLFWNAKTGEPDMVAGDAWGHFDSLCAIRYLVMGVEAGMVKAESFTRLTGREPSRREMLRA